MPLSSIRHERKAGLDVDASGNVRPIDYETPPFFPVATQHCLGVGYAACRLWKVEPALRGHAVWGLWKVKPAGVASRLKAITHRLSVKFLTTRTASSSAGVGCPTTFFSDISCQRETARSRSRNTDSRIASSDRSSKGTRLSSLIWSFWCT